ncbi:MAG: Gfo/Idh/MocA family protein, partial [Gaiella sp.]
MSRARIGVIGAGFWAAYHYLPFFRDHPDVDLVGVVRKTDEGLDAFRREFELEVATSSVAELLAAGVDGVVVSSPHSVHREHAVAALRAGAHVLVEKPMAVRLADARAIVEVGRDTGLTVSVA